MSTALDTLAAILMPPYAWWLFTYIGWRLINRWMPESVD